VSYRRTLPPLKASIVTDNPYASTAELAKATQRSQLAPRAVWCAVSSWVIVLLQGVCFLIAVAVVQFGDKGQATRDTGATVLLGIPILGAVSVLTTLVAAVLAIMAWHRKEETKPVVIAVLLTVAHGMLLMFAAGLLVLAAFAN